MARTAVKYQAAVAESDDYLGGWLVFPDAGSPH